MTSNLDAKLREIATQIKGWVTHTDMLAMRQAFALGRETMRDEAAEVAGAFWISMGGQQSASYEIRAIPIMPEEKAE